MRYGRYGWSHLVLSWGLGIVFLWIGIDALRHPDAWLGYIPEALPFALTREVALKLNGLLDVAVGALLLLRWFPRLTSLLAVVHLAGILVTQSIDAVLIRDVGLFGMSLALLMWPQHNHRRRWWAFWKRKKSSYEEE